MQTDTRRYDLDWIRVLAFGLLVFYHVGMYYVTWDWHVKSPDAGTTLEPLMMLTAPWRLSLLFFVSGAASAMLFCKRPAGYLQERTRRLLLPLVFGMLVLVAPQSYYEVVEKLPGGYDDGFFAFYQRYLAADPGFCRAGDCLILPTWNHLWFLAYLWVYVCVAWLALKALPRMWTAPPGDGAARRSFAGSAVLWAPLAWLVIARMALLERYGSTHALVDDWYNHAQYLPLFLLGFAAARAEPFWHAVRRMRWPALALALATYAFLAWYFGVAEFGEGHPPPPFLLTAQRVLWAVNQWTAIVAILGFGQALRHADNRALRYLVPAVLPIYMLHQTVIVVVAHNLQPLRIPPLIEGPMLVVVTFACCFAGYEAVRRVRWLRPLFGLKPARRTDLAQRALRSAEAALPD